MCPFHCEFEKRYRKNEDLTRIRKFYHCRSDQITDCKRQYITLDRYDKYAMVFSIFLILSCLAYVGYMLYLRFYWQLCLK